MTSEYTEGGSLYALGLIHANRGGGNTEVLSFLRSELDRTTNEVRHGRALRTARRRRDRPVMLLPNKICSDYY